MTDGINHLFSRGKPVEKRFSKEEIRTLLQDEKVHLMKLKMRLQNVMDFEKLKITDVDTTPRVNILVIILKPITFVLNKMTDGINHLFSRGKPVEKRFSKDTYIIKYCRTRRCI